jgi:hypothetical protein
LPTISGGVEAVWKVARSEDVTALSGGRLASTVIATSRFEVRDSEGLEGFIVNEIEEVRGGGWPDERAGHRLTYGRQAGREQGWRGRRRKEKTRDRWTWSQSGVA